MPPIFLFAASRARCASRFALSLLRLCLAALPAGAAAIRPEAEQTSLRATSPDRIASDTTPNNRRRASQQADEADSTMWYESAARGRGRVRATVSSHPPPVDMSRVISVCLCVWCCSGILCVFNASRGGEATLPVLLDRARRSEHDRGAGSSTAARQRAEQRRRHEAEPMSRSLVSNKPRNQPHSFHSLASALLCSPLLCPWASLRHRGPDWSGVHVHGNSIMAHERLAIVDVGQGNTSETQSSAEQRGTEGVQSGS